MKIVLRILPVLIFTSLVFAGAVVIEFKAEPSYDKTLLYWKTGDESKVNIFIVERSMDDNSYANIGEVEPRGNNSEYQFEDTKLSELNTVFYYRLQIKNKDNSVEYTESVMVIPNISSIKRTWGSIKALFR